MRRLQEAGVPAGAVLDAAELLANEQLKARDFFWEIDHPVIGKCRGNAPGFLLSKASYEVKRAPLLGEHNEYVFKDILGMTDEEIAEQVIDGAIE